MGPPADGALASVLSPSRPAHLERAAVMPMAEHVRCVDELLEQHDSEIRRSDLIHARHCASLQRALDEARAEAHDAREKGLHLEEELMAAERRRVRLERGLRREEARYSEERHNAFGRKGEAELRLEAERLQEDNSRLLSEKLAAGEEVRRLQHTSYRALAELQQDYDAACRRHDQLSAQLADGTVEYRGLHRAYHDLEAQSLRAKQRYLQLQQQFRRRDQVRAALIAQAEQAEASQREAAQRTADRTVKGVTPLNMFVSDIRALAESVHGLQRQLQSSV
eukprot:TRINITY_DN14863_c0_g2_i1.p1 TRINITY_DN14863_c0_g2~~TRINITY_DN14863_c0_g2_i1.p1  ORF type:complete len:280 (+),score=124.40 TRINITY_DN14863_c0_g2_i1:53-892(+)